MRRDRIAGPSRVVRDEHRSVAGAPAADPGGLASALKRGSPPVGNYSGRPGADPANQARLIAGILRPAFLLPGAHDHQRGGRTGRNRPVGHDRPHLLDRRLLPPHHRRSHRLRRPLAAWSATTCGTSSPSSASAHANSSPPRFPPGKAQRRRSRRRADSQGKSAHRGSSPGMAGYQRAIRRRFPTINPDGCAPGRSEHNVNAIAQTTICDGARHSADENPLACSSGISKAFTVAFGAN